MKRSGLTENILDIRREQGWGWSHIAAQIGGMPAIHFNMQVERLPDP